MLSLNITKKLYALVFCTLLITQPLQSMMSDKTYNDTLFCVLFLGGCALCGFISSLFKKHAATKAIKPKEVTTITSQDLEKKVIDLENKTKKMRLKLNKHNIDLPIVFDQINTLFIEKEKMIKKLERRCSTLEKQNIQLLTSVESIKHGINGYIPAFVAALWFNKYTEQTKVLENYSQPLSSQNILSRSS